jgi:hypothetical protein
MFHNTQSTTETDQTGLRGRRCQFDRPESNFLTASSPLLLQCPRSRSLRLPRHPTQRFRPPVEESHQRLAVRRAVAGEAGVQRNLRQMELSQRLPLLPAALPHKSKSCTRVSHQSISKPGRETKKPARSAGFHSKSRALTTKL